MQAHPGPPLPSHALRQLFAYLNSADAPVCFYSLNGTERFLVDHEFPVAETTQWLLGRGVTCDCKVLAGLWLGWPEAKAN
jgi:hypothetical protein